VNALAEAGYGRTAEAAADVVLNMVRKLQKQTAASEARPQSDLTFDHDHGLLTSSSR
jgi:hypothetical protein